MSSVLQSQGPPSYLLQLHVFLSDVGHTTDMSKPAPPVVQTAAVQGDEDDDPDVDNLSDTDSENECVQVPS